MQNHDFFFYYMIFGRILFFFFLKKKIWDNWLLLELSGAYISFFFSLSVCVCVVCFYITTNGH